MPDQIDVVEYSDYVEQVLLPTWSEETRQRYYATFPDARPAPDEIPVEQSQNDFPPPYIEPEEFLLERPIPARVKQPPLIVSPSRVTASTILRTPLSGLMVRKVATPFPRPAPPCKVQQ